VRLAHRLPHVPFEEDRPWTHHNAATKMMPASD
jgi:hypothetical protein